MQRRSTATLCKLSLSPWRLLPIAQRRSFASEAGVDGVVVGIFKGGRLTSSAKDLDNSTNGELTKRLKLADSMKGDAGNSLVLYNLGPQHPRVALMGLGKDPTSPDEKQIEDVEELEDKSDIARQAAGSGVKLLRGQGAKTIAVESFDNAQAAAEGAFLGAHKYDALRSAAADKAKPVTIVPYNVTEQDKKMWNTGATMATAENWARTLTEAPANYMTPSIFVDQVKNWFEKLEAGQKSKVDLVVRDRKWAEEQKMGCFLGVAQGSDEPPKFLEIHYNGLGSQSAKGPVVLVGKGVTFDSGGISIKPSSGMGLMRGDMGGAASVVSALYGIAALGLKAHVIALTPLCENMPSGRAIKPGDVLVAKNGKTIEVDNTDAEGRLILADALVYANDFKPHTLIDVATLTGAISVALGPLAIGAFSNNEALWNEIDKAGRSTAERMWRMPLFPAYKEQMKSDYADLKNAGKGTGGSCTAAIFLKEFVSSSRWAHLDIAGVSHNEGEKPYVPKGMSGQPTRALIEFVKNQTQ